MNDIGPYFLNNGPRDFGCFIFWFLSKRSLCEREQSSESGDGFFCFSIWGVVVDGIVFVYWVELLGVRSVSKTLF